MIRRIGLLGWIAACGASPAPVAKRHDQGPGDRAYFVTIGLPSQSFVAPVGGAAWIALGQVPYALVKADDGRVDLLSPFQGPLPKPEAGTEPMGTTQRMLEPGAPGRVEASYVLALGAASAKLVVSLDPFQPCTPYGDDVAKQVVVEQEGCFLETEPCKERRTLVARADGTYAIGPVRASIVVVCTGVAHAL